MSTFLTGDTKYIFVVPETAYGVPVVPTAAQAVRVVSATGTPDFNREYYMDEKNTASRKGRHEGRKSASVSINTYLRLGSSANSQPEIGRLLHNSMGKTPAVTSQSVAYALQRNMDALSLGIIIKNSTGHEYIPGVVLNDSNCDWSYDSPVEFKFDGRGTWVGGFTSPAKAAALGSNATELTLVEDDIYKIDVGAIISIAGAGNTPVAVTGKDGAKLTLSAAQTWAKDAVISEGLPSVTSYPSDKEPVYGYPTSLFFDGTAANVDHMSGSISITTGQDAYDRAARSGSPTESYRSGYREVLVDLSFDATQENLPIKSKAAYKQSMQVAVQFGSKPGERFRWDAGKVEFDPSDLSSPDEGTSEWNLSGPALATNGEDEITATQS